jgi:hypothetical protein
MVPLTHSTREAITKAPNPKELSLVRPSAELMRLLALSGPVVIVYDISDPFHPSFIQYVNRTPDDISPEGLLFIDNKDSPSGKPLLVVSHEISSTTTIFEITKN